jgi:hypothetical protein
MKFKDLLIGAVFTFFPYDGMDKLIKTGERTVKFLDNNLEDEVNNINYKVYLVTEI